MQLSQKETMLLSDMKSQEKLCIEKYSKHAACACDGQLKNLFTQLASAEKQHLGYLDKLLRSCPKSGENAFVYNGEHDESRDKCGERIKVPAKSNVGDENE